MWIYIVFSETATTESDTYWHTLSLHAALPICVQVRVNDRAVCRQGIGGRARGRGNNKAVGPLAIHEGAVEFNAYFDHAAAPRAVQDNVVQGQAGKKGFAFAQDPSFEQDTVFG